MASPSSIVRVILILVLFSCLALFYWQFNAAMPNTDVVENSENISKRVFEIVEDLHAQKKAFVNGRYVESDSQIVVYDYTTKKFKFYKSVHHLEHIRFSDLIDKESKYVVAKLLPQNKPSQSTDGRQNKRHKYLICAGTPKKGKDGKPMFHLAFWISIKKDDLIQFLAEVGFLRENVKNEANNLLFVRARKVIIDTKYILL